jgi:DNA polymerase I-like protein with 3'-5' exonuclease and polymerase domains
MPAKIVRPRKQALNPDQIPLITPSSDWVRPAELPTLRGVEEFAADTENKDEGLAAGVGPGWVNGAGYVAGVGISWREGSKLKKIYVPVRHPDTENFDKDQVGRWFTDISRKRRVVFFNAGYDIGWMQTDLKVPPPPTIDDASCAAFMIDENHEDLSLDGVCAWRGVPGKDLTALRETAVIYGVPAAKAVANIWRFPARYAAAYGSQDPESTLLAMEDMRPELARQGLLRAYDVEMRLVPLIHAMRRKGIRVDIDRATRLRDGLRERSLNVLSKLGERLGLRRAATLEEVRSRDTLIQWFTTENVPYHMEMREDETETAAFTKNWMRRAEHWLPRMVAEAKQCHEFADKFVQSFLLDFASGGRIHASINQWKYETDEKSRAGTRSHRLSYSDPPLQQAPSRGEPFDGWELTGEIAVEYRSCFLPEEGELWFSPDYSQQEYRHIVNDAATKKCDKADEAVELYRNDPKTDFHQLVVNWTGLGRRHAKDCNFAKAFGAGIPKFATMISKPLEEAATIMGTYDTELPFVSQLNKLCARLAEKRGYIVMYDGARSHFDQWESKWLPKEEWKRGRDEGWAMWPCDFEEAQERASTEGHPWKGRQLRRAYTHKAMNRRIQGNAARQMKAAMVTCYEEGHTPLLQMHDELSFSLLDPVAGSRIEEIMRTVYECRVPFLVDAEWGPTWGEAKHDHAGAQAQLAARAPKPAAPGRLAGADTLVSSAVQHGTQASRPRAAGRGQKRPKKGA